MDKKTQRLYYYDRVNKISQWIKPDGDVHITSYVNKDRESKTDGSSTTTTATENVATDGAAINATDIASASKESTSTAKGSSNESSVKKHHHHHAHKDFEKKPDDDDENADDHATSKADGAKSSLQEWEGDEDDSSKSKKRKKRDKGASSTKSKAKKLHKQGDFQRAKKSTSTIIRDSFDVAGGLQVSMESTDEANQLLQIPFAGVDDVREDYRALEKICAHAAYLYMYTQEALLVLNEALCKDPTMQPARSKLERLRQSLHETVLVKHGAQKLDALHVVKRAAIARPYPALSEAISPDEHVQRIAVALEAASIVCKSETTLSYNMNESDAVDKLVRSMAIPVVSMGILHWLQLLLASKTFYNGPFFHAAFPVLLNLLRQAISLHVAQWPTVFQVLVTAVRLQPESNPVKVLETKKETLRCLVHLMTCGYIFPVLHFIATQTDDLDQALLRNFIQLVLARIAPPYSLRFTTALSRILVHPKVSQALRTCPAETKTKLKEFVHVCQAEDGLATEIRHILRDCYEDN
ncbi:hypothetical protein DYB32_001350 [Aphanomyces invadans]|uniref:WW domain-containing protein n=1 Tax=Aphanomyces invadans TaxID=157072 RepID=A0A3R6WT21_9STRA|nr:hypothetical protein DYB32_001350 [Aphanomyces invadans]